MTDDAIGKVDAKELLASLRWDVDMVITNYDGERVWLGPAMLDGKRVGITDCCLVEAPCDHHANVSRRYTN